MRALALSAILWLSFAGSSAHAIIFYRISGISDIALPSWSIGDPAITAHMDMCVYTTLAGSYQITVTSASGFALTSGSNTIPYTLTWDDSGAGSLGSGGTQLSNNVALTLRQHSNSSLTSTDCSTGSPSGPNARLTLNITQASMIAALGGDYTGTITLTVGPQ